MVSDKTSKRLSEWFGLGLPETVNPDQSKWSRPETRNKHVKPKWFTPEALKLEYVSKWFTPETRNEKALTKVNRNQSKCITYDSRELIKFLPLDTTPKPRMRVLINLRSISMECLKSVSKMPFFDYPALHQKYADRILASDYTYDPIKGHYVFWMTKAHEKFDEDIRLLEENEAIERSLNLEEPDEQTYLDR